MKAIWTFVKNEPAMIAAVLVSILAVFFNWDEAQQGQYRDLIVQVLSILGGGVAVRQSVTPTSKLPKP